MALIKYVRYVWDDGILISKFIDVDQIFCSKIVAPDRLLANPDLVNKTALEIHDKVIEALTDNNVMVIMNNHVSIAYLEFEKINISLLE